MFDQAPKQNSASGGAGSELVEPDRVGQAERILKEALERLDPDVLEPAFARRLVETFARIERLAAAGKSLAARRVAETGAWKVSGERSAAHWMARKTGSSVGHAVGVLETAERLAELPATEKAIRAGKLSEVQAREIASAAAASPAAEPGLLRAADFEGMAGLKERCARVKAAAANNEVDRNEAIRRSRYLRHWSDRDGAFRLDGRFTPEGGAAVLAALEPYKHQIFTTARKQGRKEAYEAYGADALLALAQDSRNRLTAGSGAPPASALVHVRVDHSALIRGNTEPGEMCEIPGVGPIPVATARALANDAYICTIVTDGVDVKSVTHLRRNIPARLRTALVTRDPVCVVPGCEEKNRLEIDHVVPVEEQGETSLGNLARLCQWHHYLKTHQRYRLKGEPGSWCWEHPPETVTSGENPPPGHLIATRQT